MKNILKTVAQWSVAGFLFLAQGQAQGACYDACCEYNDTLSCGDIGCCNNFWAEADYLYWQIQDSPDSVPLVVEGPVVDDKAPTYGQPDTTVVLGGKSIKNDWRSGGRFALGYWFDDNHCLGIETNYFFLPKEHKKHRVFQDGQVGSTALGIPFFNVQTNKEDANFLANPGKWKGFGELNLNNSMQGAELNVVGRLPYTCDFDLVAFAGFRYWNFYEGLKFFTDSPYINDPADIYSTVDRFDAENNFYGGQLGLLLGYNCNNFFFNVKGKVAVGAMCSEVKIDGHLLTNEYDDYGAPVKYIGGYFTAPSNIGKHKTTNFSWIPEIDVNVGYKFFECMYVQIGYTAMYVSNVCWAGKQIDPRINPSQTTTYTENPTPELVGKPDPRPRNKTDGLWVQGVNAGIGFQF